MEIVTHRIITIEVDRNALRFTGFIYRKPVLTKMPVVDFQDKSLEEIESNYGRNTALYVYNRACEGKDLTAPLNVPDIQTQSFIDFMVIDDPGSSLSIYLHANKYVQAKEDVLVLKARTDAYMEHEAKDAWVKFNINRFRDAYFNKGD